MEQVNAAKALANALPADMSVKSLLMWLQPRIGTFRPDYFYFRSIPFLDDLRDPLDTLVRWEGLSGAQFASELANTLNAVAQVIQTNSSALIAAPFTQANAAIVGLPALQIGQQAEALSNALDGMRTAVVAGNSANCDSQLNAAKAAVTALASHFATLASQQAALETFETSLRGLPAALETGMGRLVLLLQPRSAWADVSARVGGAPLLVSADDLAPVTELFNRIKEFFENLLGVLDVSAATDPIAEVFNQIGAAVDEVEQALVQLTAAARAQFEQAAAAIAGLDLGDIVDQAEQAMDDAVNQVQQALVQGLGTAGGALGTAITAVEDALNSFDPEQLTAPIQQVFDAVRQVFEDPAVADALAQLQSLTQYADRIGELSFAPVTDVVIDGIGEVKSALDSIDDTSLSPPLPEMIDVAMAVLPQSVKPLTDPLVAELAGLIQAGPVQLLEELKALPKPLFDQIRAFEPQALLGDVLSKPFQDMRGQMQEFAPEHWLEVAEQELDKLRQRLVQSANPGQALAPVVEAFDQFMAELEKLRPGDLLEPVDQRLQAVMHSVAEAVPVDDLIDLLNGVLDKVKGYVALPRQALEVARAFADKLAALADPQVQFDQWLDQLFAKLPADAAFGASLSAIKNAVQASRAAGLQLGFDTAAAGLIQALAAAGARAKLATLISRRAALAAAVQAHGDVSSGGALATWLGSFDPMAPAFNAGFQRLGRLEDALSSTRLALGDAFDGWDARYHRDGGPLQAVVQEGASASQVRDWVREAVQRQLGAPVVGLLQQLQGLAVVLNRVLEGLESLADALDAKLAEVLSAPQALIDALSEVDQLVDRIGAVNLDVLQEGINQIYDTLLEQARAFDPRRLQQALNEKFGQLVDTLSLDSVFTPALREQLDSAWRAVLAKVDALDPDLLLVEPLQALYDEQVAPLVEVFDVTQLIDQVIERLKPLEQELQGEMERVDSAYREMLGAAPGGSGGGASAGLSV